jgi:succinate dehydrogenase / fumarate reductase iron-sulfur subunit
MEGNLPMAQKWTITLKIFRKKDGQPSHFDTFQIDVDPDEYVLDAVERIWAFHDRSLVFRHACHHSTCGACGMLVNGVEKLTCITLIREITHNGGVVRIEPMKNFPIISDLAVDMTRFYIDLDTIGFDQVGKSTEVDLPYEAHGESSTGERLVDCIECGLCISACPAAATSTTYFGPATLAAAELSIKFGDKKQIIDLVDAQDGAWRCHSAFECSEVCPSNVDPAWRIMHLRRIVIQNRISSFFLRSEDGK